MRMNAITEWVRGYEAEQARLVKVERAKLIIRSRMQCYAQWQGFLLRCVDAERTPMCPSCAAGQKLEGL